MTPTSPLTAATDDRGRLRIALRLSWFYAAAFAVLGVYMPYWPVWLHSRGLGPEAIAGVMSGQIVARTIAGPLWAQHADHSGRPARVLRRLSLLSCLCFLPFAFTDSYYGLFACSLLFGIVYPPIHPILDTLAVGHAHSQGFAYGRVRMWGSIAFLLVNVTTGFLLQRLAGAAGLVLYMVGSGLLLAAFASWQLPEQVRPPRATPAPTAAADAAPRRGGAIFQLLSTGRFLLFLATVGLLQGSHAAYYAFSTLHWRAHGIGEDTAGLLWAEGVLAEITLFASMTAVTRRLRPTSLLLLGSAGAMLRWIVIAESTSLPVLLLVNWLHAASFGLVYLGGVQFMARHVPATQSATAQGLVGAATAGVFMAIGTRLAGTLYDQRPELAFLAMAAMAALGGLGALWLRAGERR